MRKITLAAIGFAATALAWGYGQAATEVFKGTLSTGAEVPPVTGTGSGAAVVNFDPATKLDSEPFVLDALSFERRMLEAQLNRSDVESIETLRAALRRYRSISRRPWPY